MGLSDLTRFVQFVCALGLFGIAVWQPVPARRAKEDLQCMGSEARWLLVLYSAGCLLGAAATIGWLLAEANSIAGDWHAIGSVIVSTHFGAVAVVRAALLLIAAAMAWVRRRHGAARWRILSALTAIAVVSFVWTGHGATGAGATAGLHMLADALHLLCAALWFGALIMLSAGALRAVASKGHLPSAALLAGLSRFSAVGPALIGLLVATGCVNTWLLTGAGRWHALVREPYGWVLIVKLALFGGMLALALEHRYRSTPVLRQALVAGVSGEADVGVLRRTLLAETFLAILILAAVALLGNLEPPVSA